MADVSSGRSRAVFEFKSATLPLIAVILKTTDLDVLAEALDAQLADTPDFLNRSRWSSTSRTWRPIRR